MVVDPSDLNSLGRGSNSDIPGRRYYKANGSFQTPLGYDKVTSNVSQNQVLFASKKRDSVYGASIMQVSREELAQTHMSPQKPSDIKGLLNDSGLHLLRPKDLKKPEDPEEI